MSYDQFLASLCIWREARGESMTVMNAVYWVILNRSKDVLKRWPQSLSDVVLEHDQFSSFDVGDPNATLFPTRTSPLDWNAFLRCQIAVQAPIGGDPTQGANGYFAPKMGVAPPDWADPSKHTVTIGPFMFYKL